MDTIQVLQKNPHKDFTSDEHKEAAELHNKNRKEGIEEYFKKKYENKNKTKEDHDIAVKTAMNGKDLGFMDKDRAERHLMRAKAKEVKKD